MRLITKEVVAKAILLDPIKHDGLIVTARLLMRSGAVYTYEAAEQVKGGLAFRIPSTGELVMVDEEELVGLTVDVSTLLLHKHEVKTLPDLLAWLAKR